MSSSFRGCFSSLEDSSPLKNGVPLFNTKQEALQWCEDVVKNCGSSNREYDARLMHCVTTFVGKQQLEKYLIPRVNGTTVRTFSTFTPSASDRDDFETRNVFAREARMVREIRDRLEGTVNEGFHKRLSAASTLNMLSYTFDHMRCGILVQIRDNAVVTFAPYVNDDYRNTWGDFLKTGFGSLEEYYEEKSKFYRREKYLPDPHEWWVNGNIVCNEMDVQMWGDNLLLPFKHMLEETCRKRRIPDCDFFFNKRDFPQLRNDLTEPYDFMFDERRRPLPKARQFGTLTPVVSFYTSPNFADLPVPTTEDWKGTVGRVFPETTIPKIKEPSDLFTSDNFSKFSGVKWEDKKEVAFFRGNATGGGTTPETNQRLRLAKIGHDTRSPLLDVGVTGYNLRDKKLFGSPMTFAREDELPPKVPAVPMYEQGKYKYIVYVDGHCAANRYAFLMKLGVVILRVASVCEASELWFFPLLSAHDIAAGQEVVGDHILIKPDLSDLIEKVEWCKANDAAARRIAENSKRKYATWLNPDAVMDYWELLLREIAKRNVVVPDWFDYAPPSKDFELLEEIGKFANVNNGKHQFCASGKMGEEITCKRCREELEEKARGRSLPSSSSSATVKEANERSASSTTVTNSVPTTNVGTKKWCKKCRLPTCICDKEKEREDVKRQRGERAD